MSNSRDIGLFFTSQKYRIKENKEKGRTPTPNEGRIVSFEEFLVLAEACKAEAPRYKKKTKDIQWYETGQNYWPIIFNTEFAKTKDNGYYSDKTHAIKVHSIFIDIDKVYPLKKIHDAVKKWGYDCIITMRNGKCHIFTPLQTPLTDRSGMDLNDRYKVAYQEIIQWWANEGIEIDDKMADLSHFFWLHCPSLNPYKREVFPVMVAHANKGGGFHPLTLPKIVKNDFKFVPVASGGSTSPSKDFKSWKDDTFNRTNKKQVEARERLELLKDGKPFVKANGVDLQHNKSVSELLYRMMIANYQDNDARKKHPFLTSSPGFMQLRIEDTNHGNPIWYQEDLDRQYENAKNWCKDHDEKKPPSIRLRDEERQKRNEERQYSIDKNGKIDFTDVKKLFNNVEVYKQFAEYIGFKPFRTPRGNVILKPKTKFNDSDTVKQLYPIVIEAEISKRFLSQNIVSKTCERLIEAFSMFAPEFDDIKYEFDELYKNTTITHKDPMDTLLTTYINDDKNTHDFDYLMLRKWFIAAVRRVRVPGTRFEGILTLVGTQGNGKSTVIEALGMGNSINYNFGTDPRENNMFQSETRLIIFEELAKLSKVKDTRELKIMTGSTEGKYYAKGSNILRTYKRHNSFAATSDKKEYLPNWEGNRRFLNIEYKICNNKLGTKGITVLEDLVKQCYKFAMDLDLTDEDLYLDFSAIKKSNIKFTDPDEAYDALTDLVSTSLEIADRPVLLNKTIKEYISEYSIGGNSYSTRDTITKGVTRGILCESTVHTIQKKKKRGYEVVTQNTGKKTFITFEDMLHHQNREELGLS